LTTAFRIADTDVGAALALTPRINRFSMAGEIE